MNAQLNADAMEFADKVTASVEDWWKNAGSVEHTLHIWDETAEIIGPFFKAFAASTDPRMWIELIREETAELEEAAAEYELLEQAGADEWKIIEAQINVLKEAADVAYVLGGFSRTSPEDPGDIFPEEEFEAARKTIMAGFDLLAAANLYYTAPIILEAVGRVHESNMTKLGEDGQPIRRDDGKILKGQNYQPPTLIDLVELRNDLYEQAEESAAR